MKNTSTRWIKLLLALMVVAGVLKFLVSIGGLVKLIVIGALLAYILDPLTRSLEARGIGRTSSTVVVFIGLLLVLTVFVFLLLPHISGEVKAIQSGVSTAKAADLIRKIEGTIQEKFAFLGLKELNLLENLRSFTADSANRILGYFLNAVSLVTNLLIIPFIIFFLLKDGRDIKRRFIALVPNRYFEFSMSLLQKMDLQIGNYLRGQCLDALIIGIISIIVLRLLDVKYFLIIGTFAGLANIIPFIGPIAGAVPAVVVSILETGNFTKAFYVLLAFVLVQLIDNAVVKPVVVARMVSMHPVMVLLVVIIGGKFFGILGMILSVPAYGISKVIAHEAIHNFRKYRFT
jgi:putative permease